MSTETTATRSGTGTTTPGKTNGGAPVTAPADAPLIFHESSLGLDAFGFRELWRYRDLLYFLAWRDVKVRYKQAVLGAAWALFQPVLLMTVFWLFLGKVAKAPTGDLPYAIFVLSGLLPWFLYSTTVSGAAISLLDNDRLITKVYFPRLAIPFATAGPAILDFAVTGCLLAGAMAVEGIAPSWTIVLAPLSICLIVLTALGAGSLLAALNVSYRDFRYVVPFVIQAWLFATPTIYLATGTQTGDLPAIVQWCLAANPLTGLIAFFRAAVFGLPLPWADLGLGAIAGVGVFSLGCLYFRRVEDRFADII